MKGINIRTLVRFPDVLGNRLQGAEIIKGSQANPYDISACLADSDAVICVFGPRPPFTDIFCEEATRQIIIAMKEYNLQHLLCQTGGMVGGNPGNRTIFFKDNVFPIWETSTKGMA